MSSEEETYALEQIDEVFDEGESERTQHTSHEEVTDDGLVLHISLMTGEKLDSFFERRCENDRYETTGYERAVRKV